MPRELPGSCQSKSAIFRLFFQVIAVNSPGWQTFDNQRSGAIAGDFGEILQENIRLEGPPVVRRA
jgi:hypothetical protein